MSGRIAAILGAGEVGAAWAARFVLMGWQVRVFDPDPGAGARLDAMLARARASLPALYDTALPPEGPITRCTSLAEAVAGADWIQESVPDRRDLKRKLLQKAQETCPETAVIASSTMALGLADLRGCATRPAQILIVAPASPVYLRPSVRMVTEPDDPEPATARATALLHSIGMAARAPDSADLSYSADLDEDTLVALLRTLKARGVGEGLILKEHEATLIPPAPDPDSPTPPVTLRQQVPITWVDYNGHMNESFYLTAFSNACDRLLAWAGMDTACIAQGHSVFTVETHIRHLDEVNIGDIIHVRSRVLEGGGKKFHIWQELFVGDRLCATGEQLLLHVDLETRRSAPPRADVAGWLSRAQAAHAHLPPPDGLGRAVAQRR